MASFKVLSRLRKLLALATSSNPHEASAASDAARRLMKRHGLTEADAAGEGEDELVELSLGARGFASAWKFSLATLAARAHSCEALGLRLGKRRKVRVVGKRSDAEAAASLFHLLDEELSRLAKVEMAAVILICRRVDRRSVHLAARYLDNFRRGAVAGFAARLAKNARSGNRAPQSGPAGEGLVRTGRGRVKDHLVASGAREVQDLGVPLGPPDDLADDLAYVFGYEQAFRSAVLKRS